MLGQQQTAEVTFWGFQDSLMTALGRESSLCHGSQLAQGTQAENCCWPGVGMDPIDCLRKHGSDPSVQHCLSTEEPVTEGMEYSNFQREDFSEWNIQEETLQGTLEAIFFNNFFFFFFFKLS